MQTLVVQQPHEDRIVTLRARTLRSVGPSVDEKRVVDERDEFAEVLRRSSGSRSAASAWIACGARRPPSTLLS